MDIIKTAIPGVVVIEPKRFGDARGFFMELYRAERYAAAGIGRPFVQDNFSRSARGVLRGLHLQNPNPQGKLIGVLSGRILDVVVDVRRGSPTFGKHVAMELSGANEVSSQITSLAASNADGSCSGRAALRMASWSCRSRPTCSTSATASIAPPTRSCWPGTIPPLTSTGR